MQYELPKLENGREIKSVGSFIQMINTICIDRQGESTDMFFRGQETDFWGIEPSIFRNDMISVEHILMQQPLRKSPLDFKEFDDDFSVMTKYQHYGMCTRMLDLTTNPLVALYFACQEHGKVQYNNSKDFIEPYGMIYYKFDYPIFSDDIKVKIISYLAKYDLSKENTISKILSKLFEDNIITKAEKDKLSDDNYRRFIEIIQEDYLVLPIYTNQRLIKQSGVFLLSGSFNFNLNENIDNSIIVKSKKNLKDSFETGFFYIDGNNKCELLKELDLYNVNEATLFPELEHQLNYIKYINKFKTTSVADFNKYSFNERKSIIKNIKPIDNVDKDIYLDKLKEQLQVENFEEEIINNILMIFSDNMVIDWYKREDILSRIKIGIRSKIIRIEKYRKHNIKIAEDIVKNAISLYEKLSK